MTVLQLMERVGSNEPGKVLAYIQDALDEMQSILPETVTRTTMDVEEDTRYYSLPTTMIRLLGVYRKYNDDGKYVRISRIENIDLLDDTSASSSSSDDNIVVV